MIRDTLSVLATSAQHEQDEEDQHLFEQRLLVSDHAFPDGEHTDEDEDVNRALEEWSLSSKTTWTTDESTSTQSTSVDGASVGEDTTGARKFLQTLFPYL